MPWKAFMHALYLGIDTNKILTLVSGLDYGLDYGLDLVLEFGMDSRINIVFQNLPNLLTV